MNGMPTVGVVILTRDRPGLLERSLRAVLEDPATSEVLVMVDHRAEEPRETRELLDRLAAGEPRLRWERISAVPEGKWWVEHARDVGVEQAGSEVILALDDDVVAEPGMVSGHARMHADAAGRVVVGYMPVASEVRWPRSSAPLRHCSDAYEGTCDLYRSDPNAILLNLWGGNVSIRRADWLSAIQGERLAAWGHDDQEQGLLFARAGSRTPPPATSSTWPASDPCAGRACRFCSFPRRWARQS